MLYVSVETLAEHPFPALQNFILDIGRSQTVVKIFIKKDYCTYVSTTVCNERKGYTIIEKCSLYTCFGNINVTTPVLTSGVKVEEIAIKKQPKT